jgi:hypothetical protein
LNGKEVEIPYMEHEITNELNSKSDNDETMPKISPASILCTQKNMNEKRVSQEKLLLEKKTLKNLL